MLRANVGVVTRVALLSPMIAGDVGGRCTIMTSPLLAVTTQLTNDISLKCYTLINRRRLQRE